MNKREISKLKVGDVVWEVCEDCDDKTGVSEWVVFDYKVLNIERVSREDSMYSGHTHILTLTYHKGAGHFYRGVPSNTIHASKEAAIKVALRFNRSVIKGLQKFLAKLIRRNVAYLMALAKGEVKKTGKKVVRGGKARRRA